MTTSEITCPSGMSGVLRGWKVREVKALLDAPAGSGATSALNRVLAAIFEPSPDALGPYTLPINWNKVLVGDRAFILIRSRQLTFDGDYSVRIQCPNRACSDKSGKRPRFWWDIDLTELRVQPYPEASLAKFREDNRFTIQVNGATIVHKLLVGDEGEIAGAHPDLTAVLANRIVSINGMEDRKKILRIVEDWDLGDIRSMLKAFDEHEGGVDTEIEAECDTCGTRFDLDLPFGRDFFLPDFRRGRTREIVET